MNIIFRDQIYKPYPVEEESITEEVLLWLAVIATEVAIIILTIKYY
jgi:hypothetical protein